MCAEIREWCYNVWQVGRCMFVLSCGGRIYLVCEVRRLIHMYFLFAARFRSS